MSKDDYHVITYYLLSYNNVVLTDAVNFVATTSLRTQKDAGAATPARQFYMKKRSI